MTNRVLPSIQTVKDTHQRRRFVKNSLVIVGVLLILGLVVWPYIAEFLEEESIKSLPQISVESVDLDKKTVTNPKIVGVDSDLQPYELTASLAEQKDDDQVILTNVQGTMKLKDGKSVWAQSNKGQMTANKTESVYLYDGVQLTYDRDNHATTKDAKIDFKEGMIYGSNSIEGKGPDGVTSAQEFWFDYKKKIFVFKGNASLTIFNSK
jgi:LPS export ABC transporter protein LptC